MTLCGWDREFKALFYSAASLCYQVPDTLLETTPITLYWHIIRTLGRPVPAIPWKSECQAKSNWYFCLTFVIRSSGSNPVTPDLGVDTLPIVLAKERNVLTKINNISTVVTSQFGHFGHFVPRWCTYKVI